jgi:hypothetical protein
MMNMQGSMIHPGMQAPPQPQQQNNYAENMLDRSRPEDAAAHITVSHTSYRRHCTFIFSIELYRIGADEVVLCVDC